MTLNKQTCPAYSPQRLMTCFSDIQMASLRQRTVSSWQTQLPFPEGRRPEPLPGLCEVSRLPTVKHFAGPAGMKGGSLVETLWGRAMLLTRYEVKDIWVPIMIVIVIQLCYFGTSFSTRKAFN